MTDDLHAESDTCLTCGKPAHPKHFLGACGPVSTWPNRAAPRKESVVSDDPREILKAAGVECAEVEVWYGPWTYSEEVDVSVASEKAEDAILALARIVSQLASDKSDCQEAAQRANEAASLANQDNERLRGEVAKYKGTKRRRSIWRA